MAVSSPPARNARPGASLTATRGRGRPVLVTIRKTTLIGGLLEGMALAQETLSAAEQIQIAAATGNRSLVTHLAGRLGYRATKANAEFRRLVQEVEE